MNELHVNSASHTPIESLFADRRPCDAKVSRRYNEQPMEAFVNPSQCYRCTGIVLHCDQWNCLFSVKVSNVYVSSTGRWHLQPTTIATKRQLVHPQQPTAARPDMRRISMTTTRRRPRATCLHPVFEDGVSSHMGGPRRLLSLLVPQLLLLVSVVTLAPRIMSTTQHTHRWQQTYDCVC